jgi:DNA-binding transcriptional LysR family regulator
MHLDKLRTFVAVAEERSFSAAGERLHRSQPAVSRQIAALELSLGLKLLERGTRQVVLTGAGRELLDRARNLLRDAGELDARMSALAAGKVGTLRIGATPVSVESVMAPILSAFTAKWRNIELVLVQDSAAGLFNQLESGRLHVAVSRYVTTDSLRCKRWFPTYVVALVHSAHRFANQRAVDLGELSSETLLLATPESGSRILIDHACELSGLRLRRIFLESPNIRGLAAMAEAALGVAIVLSSVNLMGLQVVRIPVHFRGNPLGTWAGAIWSRAREMPEYAEDFVRVGAAITRHRYPGYELQAPTFPKSGKKGEIG